MLPNEFEYSFEDDERRVVSNQRRGSCPVRKEVGLP